MLKVSNQTDPTNRSSIIIRKSIDKNLLIKNSAAMFVVDNMKMRQQGEDPGNELEFKFHLCKLFISILLSSTLVTGEGFEIAKSFPGKSSKMTLESLRFKSC